MISIRIPFIPTSVNRMYRAGQRRVYKTSSAKASAETLAWEIRKQYPALLRNDDITLTVRFFFENRRRRDSDNLLKQLFDAGTGIIWRDDSQIRRYTVERTYSGGPRLELDIEEPCG